MLRTFSLRFGLGSGTEPFQTSFRRRRCNRIRAMSASRCWRTNALPNDMIKPVFGACDGDQKRPHPFFGQQSSGQSRRPRTHCQCGTGRRPQLAVTPPRALSSESLPCTWIAGWIPGLRKEASGSDSISAKWTLEWSVQRQRLVHLVVE
jgi:hypothetical protein